MSAPPVSVQVLPTSKRHESLESRQDRGCSTRPHCRSYQHRKRVPACERNHGTVFGQEACHEITMPCAVRVWGVGRWGGERRVTRIFGSTHRRSSPTGFDVTRGTPYRDGRRSHSAFELETQLARTSGRRAFSASTSKSGRAETLETGQLPKG